MVKIDADRLEAEIIRLRKEQPFHDDASLLAYLHGLSKIEDFIDSLQQEQSCETCTNDKGCVTCKDGELWEGKEQMPMPEDTVIFQKGIEEGKRLMMKDAVKGTYNTTDWGVPCIGLDMPLDLERFDKVKIVIVKEEEK